VTPLVISQVAEEVRHQAGLDDIVALLNQDKRLTPTKLRELAYELNVSVPSTAKTKPAIVLYIAHTLTHGAA
jgi:hypothetical protein